MFNKKALRHIDWRLIPILFVLASISLAVISSFSRDDSISESFFTPPVKQQLMWYAVGTALFLSLSAFDYNKLRDWAWPLYGITTLSLIGLFFVEPIQNVHRWYRIPGLGFSIQPSEYAKIITVISLSWFLERHLESSKSLLTALKAVLIVFIPFILILKQPDLGTSLVLIPITLVMFYLGGVHPFVIRTLSLLIGGAILFISLKFTGVISHEDFRPIAQTVLKEYQYDRLDPTTHHQKAAQTAIAIGGLFGTGYGKSEFTGGGWLPMPYTDSVFPAFGEEFGLLGMILLLTALYILVFLAFKTAAVAKDPFGRLLAAGIAVYLAMHIVINVGMMVGFLPITGVPLVFVTYGGSSLLSTMAALGILESIYARRFFI